MGWLLKMPLRRFDGAVFERDKALIPFLKDKGVKYNTKKGVNFICRKGVKCLDYLHSDESGMA